MSRLAQKKLPKWLRHIWITKKCVFNNLKKITLYYNNGFEEDIYVYTYMYVYIYIYIYIYIYTYIYIIYINI